MTKVMVPQETWLRNADLSSFQRYGTPEFVLHRQEVPGIAPAPAFLKLQRWLRDEFNPDIDSITVMPSDPLGPVLMGIALERLGLASHGFQWLRYDRERRVDTGGRTNTVGFYVPVTVKLEDR